jgi:hypothetical protein
LKRNLFTLLCVLLAFALGVVALVYTNGCSKDELANVSSDYEPIAPPSTSPSSQPATTIVAATTQKIESIEEKFDKVADQVQSINAGVNALAKVGKSAGVPFSDYVYLGSGIVGTLAAAYQNRRNKGLSQSLSQQQTATGVLHAALANHPGAEAVLTSALAVIGTYAPSAQVSKQV